MLIWLESWMRLALRRVLRDERGQSELIIILIVIFVIYLISTGRRVVVQ